MEGERGSPVREGADRFGSPAFFLNGRFDCKVSGQETEGRLCIIDTVRTHQGGPPLHLHHEQEEWFFVREGEFLFQVGADVIRLKAGDSILAPRGVPHTFANVTDAARLMIVFQPAGTIEEFFRQGSLLDQATREDFIELHRRHGMEVVGPPLKLG
jgi:quercetin dioxygenase-like cupin family protein